ncbi:MAG: alpha-glucosidase [Saprospiraceae bacterium]|nr:alpha-glucosidase [Saprospiraceae bacterium]
MNREKFSMVKRVMKLLGILLGILLIFIFYVIWVNVSGGLNREELLAKMPEQVNPKYGMDKDQTWWKETSVYQIYPRSYKDSDGDGIGDLKGIISKLDYIESLGFETIWFSPFFRSPQKDHGYDVSDYINIQEEYGDSTIVDSLINEIHKRDMKVVFDLVLNHSSDKHPWFLESRSSKDNPKSDWYVWKDGKDGGPPNNWKNILGQQSAWNYSPERDQYYYAAFLPFQPDLNMRNPEVKAAISDMVRYWLDKGVDGFRLDIFNFIYEDENFADNPFTWQFLPKMEEGKWMMEEHKYNFHQPEVVEYAKELRAILESYPGGRFMVGEVFGSHLHMRELLGMDQLDGLNLVFLFDFLEGFEFSADYFRQKAEEYEAFYPAPLTPTYVFGNHDQFRSITRLDNDERKAEVLATFQMTMRGVPFVYQGEEIGMRTGDISLEDAQDPLSKGFLKYPEWIRNSVAHLMNRDNCRTPMQWNDDVSAGFSSNAKTWLPVQDDYPEVNVEDKLEDEGSLLNTYRNLLMIRKENSVFRNGMISFIDQRNLPKDVLAYERNDGTQKVLVYLNFSSQKRTVSISPNTRFNVIFNKRSGNTKNEIELDDYGILIVQME